MNSCLSEMWNHNAMVDGVFEEFVKEIDAKVAEGVSEKTRQMAKAMREQGVTDSIIAKVSGLSLEEISRL